MALLDAAAIEERLTGLPGWQRDGDQIRKTFQFQAFPDAIAFVGRVADRAEAADHHPDIDIRYTRVTMTLSTHSAGGLTRKDFDLAHEIEGVTRSRD